MKLFLESSKGVHIALFNIHLFIITQALSIITRDIEYNLCKRTEINKMEYQQQKKEYEKSYKEKKNAKKERKSRKKFLYATASSGNLKAIKHPANEVLITYNR